jgi:nucleoid-associated protein YgaU
MRWLRGFLLLGLLAGGTLLVTAAVLGPLMAGRRAVAVAASTSGSAGAPGADLTTLLTGGCAVLVGLAWLWLVAAVTACTADALRAAGSDAVHQGSTLLRPRAVRAVVAACLGVTALAGPASAQSPVTRVRALPDDLRAAAVTAPATSPRLLDGLPVPDRVHGGLHDRVTAPARRLDVAPGDSLWALTAALLPPGAPADAVASGWRLLYAANRAVVGADPDLLQPGQTLRVSPALEALVRSAGAARAPHHPTPLDSDAGGPR